MESPHINFILSIAILIFKAWLFLKLALQVNEAYICWILTIWNSKSSNIFYMNQNRNMRGLTHSPCRRKNMSSRESPKLWSRIIWKLKSHPQCDSRWCLLQTQVTILSRFFSKSFESPVVKVATISWFSACYIERENSFIVYSTNIHTFLDPIILYSLPTT